MTAVETDPPLKSRVNPDVELEQIALLERLLRVCTWLLRISSVVALGLVSWGSYSTVRWVGAPIPVAFAFPVVIDCAMLYVTPFAVNAILPSSEEWPVRKRAGRLRAFVWATVAAFNLLHSLLSLTHPANDGAVAPPLTGPLGVAAVAVAVVLGVGPVVFYGYAYALESMVKSWVLARQSDIRRIAAEQTTVKQDSQEAAAITAWLDAEEKWRRSTARREAVKREDSQSPRTAIALQAGANPQVSVNKRDVARDWILSQVSAGKGHELKGPMVDRVCGGSGTGRSVLGELRAAGECPPFGEPWAKPTLASVSNG